MTTPQPTTTARLSSPVEHAGEASLQLVLELLLGRDEVERLLSDGSHQSLPERCVTAVQSRVTVAGDLPAVPGIPGIPGVPGVAGVSGGVAGGVPAVSTRRLGRGGACWATPAAAAATGLTDTGRGKATENERSDCRSGKRNQKIQTDAAIHKVRGAGNQWHRRYQSSNVRSRLGHVWV